MKFDTQYCWSKCLHELSWYVHDHNYTNMIQYELSLSDSMMLFENNKQSENHKKINLKITFSNSFLKYIRYKLNHSTCSHENKIMRYLLSQWKILRRLSNQSHMLIHVSLYLKNITIWLMFLRDKKLMNWPHIRKNTTSELIWNQERLQVLNLCMTCHETNCRCYNNIWMSILQKILFDQAVLHLHSWYCLQKNWTENYDFVLIIEFWMQSQFKINIQFFWFKKC